MPQYKDSLCLKVGFWPFLCVATFDPGTYRKLYQLQASIWLGIFNASPRSEDPEVMEGGWKVGVDKFLQWKNGA